MLYTALGSSLPGMIGLSAGIDPSRLIRRILPLRLSGSWALAATAPSPIPSHSLPDASISTAQPLCWNAAAAPVKMTSAFASVRSGMTW